MTVILHQFGPLYGLPNASPFCMKLESFLRLAGLEYDTTDLGDLSEAPLGRGPWMTIDGDVVPDSSICIDELKKRFNLTVDDHLNPTQKAIAHGFQRLVEDHLYYGLVYSRWIDNWDKVKADYFAGAPDEVAEMYRAKQQKKLELQGAGQFPREQLFARMKKDIDAIADYLGDKPYFMGDKISTVDCTIHALLANIMVDRFASPLSEYVEQCDNLAPYVARLTKELYGD